MTTLGEVRRALEERKDRLSFVKLSSVELRLNNDGQMVAGGTWRPLREAQKWLAHHAGIPSDFFCDLEPDLQAVLFNRLYAQGLASPQLPAEVSVAVLDDRVAVGIADARFAVLSGLEVLEAALEPAPADLADGEDAFAVERFEMNGRLNISLVSPQVSAEPRVGDVVRAGVDVFHSDSGACPTQLNSYLFRLACKNGMLVRVCPHEEDLRIRRGGPETKAALLGRVRYLAGLAWADLKEKLDLLKQLAQERVDDPAAVIERIARDHGLSVSRKLLQELTRALGEDEFGNERTLFDVANAFARLGTHGQGRPLAWRRRMLFASGEILREKFERCRLCRAILRQRRA